MSIRFVADLLCPERCAACPALVAPTHLFCTACSAGVRLLGPPECGRCGYPLGPNAQCPECHACASPIRTARAWAAYHHPSGTSAVALAIARFKYAGAQRLGRRFAATIAARVVHADVELVIPVPLHPRRLRRRGFNQSAVVARHVARRLGGATSAPTVVVRTRDTPSQTALTPVERAANVAGAFAVRNPSAVRGRAVLVVDDVWTSGATTRAVAAALCAAGAAAVDVLTIARVL